MSQGPVQIPLPGFEAARARWQDSYNQQMGEETIRRNRSGVEIRALYTPGDWIRLEATFTERGCFDTVIDYQSAYGDTVVMMVRLLNYPSVGEELRANYVMNEGQGFG